MTLEEYVKDHGYEVSDFTQEELEEIRLEVDMVNNGTPFLDGFFSNFIPPQMRKGLD